MNSDSTDILEEEDSNHLQNLFRFVFASLFGIFIFFIPVTYNGQETIPLDHIVSLIIGSIPTACAIFTFAIIVIGGILPFVQGTWKKDGVTIAFSLIKLLAIGPVVMVMFNIGPSVLMQPNMLPFLFKKVAIPVGIIVPIGATLLTFITGYGLLEFIGVLMRPIMRPIWKLPGLATVNAVTSFVGSFAIGILLTNRLYNEGKFTKREAVIVIGGFSTASAAFMVIVTKTLGLMERWNTFFWVTLFVTFAVSAIIARLWPLNSYEDSYATPTGNPEPEHKGDLFKGAYHEGIKGAGNAPALIQNLKNNFVDGMIMNLRMLPSILSFGVISLLLIKMTPVFDILAYIYYPITKLFGIPDAMLVAKASAIVGAEMFIPSVLAAGAGAADASKFVIGVVSISVILFFSGSIPVIIATDVKFSLRHMLVVILERTVLTLLIVCPIAMLLF